MATLRWFPAGDARILGLDLSRGLAIIGMFAAHTLLLDDFDWRTPITWGAIVDGRSAATFAVLAGVSLAIISGGMSPASGTSLVRARVRILVRALLIFLLGAALTGLDTNVYVILEYYAVVFVLALPVLRWRVRALFGLAATLAVVAPVAQLVLARLAVLYGVDLWPPVDLLVTGAYPAMLWCVFVLVGIGIGRLDLRARAVQARLFVIGAILAVIGYGSGAVAALAVPGSAAADLPAAGVATAASPTSLFDLAALLTVEPHSGSPFELVGASGFAVALIALCLRASGPVLRAVSPVVATGSMALSAYTGQIVALAFIGPGYWIVGRNNAPLFFALTVLTLLLCTLWAAFAGRGPLERLLTTVSRRVADMATRTRSLTS